MGQMRVPHPLAKRNIACRARPALVVGAPPRQTSRSSVEINRTPGHSPRNVESSSEAREDFRTA